jgi:hypothetical protein
MGLSWSLTIIEDEVTLDNTISWCIGVLTSLVWSQGGSGFNCVHNLESANTQANSNQCKKEKAQIKVAKAENAHLWTELFRSQLQINTDLVSCIIQWALRISNTTHDLEEHSVFAINCADFWICLENELPILFTNAGQIIGSALAFVGQFMSIFNH